MERENDVQLIRRILSGNDEAFSVLVRKHQKSIHALAWRKVGDFHIAEEITQDTFLSVYKNLAQLKNPNQFAGWVYVIANRFCLKWLQKNKPVMQSLEDTPAEEIENSSYTHHVSDQRQTEVTEDRRELVKNLLAQLPESERTVVSLYYLGEMTAKEIGKFLGVSVNTIKSRLRRGRKRLQEQQIEPLVRETLGSLPFPAQVTERIMRQVADINPTAPPAGKPLLPWKALGTTAVLVILLLGATNQYLARFQKPYSFEAQSEPTIEIVDAPIILNITAKPTVRNRVGQAAAGKNSGTGTQVSTTTTASVTLEDSAKFSTSQWTQGSAPPGGHVRDIFATSEGNVYAVAPTGIYRLGTDATTWTRINTDIPIGKSLMPMAEHGGTLYIVSTDEIFTSGDKGETWRTIGPRPRGDAVGLIITDEVGAKSPRSDSQAHFTMYLALRDEGIYRSTDGGIHWDSFNDGLASKEISTVAAVEKTVFAGTGRGLYRLDSGIWKKLPVEMSRAIYSLAVFEKNLYVGTGPHLLGLTPIEGEKEVPRNESHVLKIFHSADLGASWTEITPSHKSYVYDREIPSGMKVLVTGETLLVSTAPHQYRSTDNGHTWTELSGDTDLFMINRIPAVTVNETTFYKAGLFGTHRTTDGGKSWQLLIDGMVGTRLKDLVAFNDRLYAHTGYAVYQSTDEGASWKKLPITVESIGKVTTITTLSSKPDSAYVSNFFNSKLIVDDNNLYLISPETNNLQIARISTDGNIRSPIQSIPTSDDKALSHKLRAGSEAALSEGSEKAHHTTIVSIVPPPIRGEDAITRMLVVCNDVFYAEHRRTLFKWRLGAPEWISTGLTDMSQESYDNDSQDLKLAVSGETIYVGKRDGKLFQSLDEGSSWRDVTPSLPLHFTRFNEITFVDSTVYVATDAGVLSSETGAHWRVLTDNAGTRPFIDRFAVDGTTIYGVSDIGAYRLDTGNQWKRVSSEALGETVDLAVLNDKLYSAIKDSGIYHISLAKE